MKIRTGSIHLRDNDFIPLITKLLVEEFHADINEVNSSMMSFARFVNSLIDDIWVFIETQYVDKVYRDSYYNYFASKANNYPRNCVKLSFFFNLPTPLPTVLDAKEHELYQQHFGGFLVLRPTFSSIIGRNAIAPCILKKQNFLACLTPIQTTVDGLKFSLNAFPASSQDGETISCAETTMWSMMEYFGNKYTEYKPTLPSNIIRTLESVSVERQLPSAGLTPDNLSFLAKCYGFGPRIYHRDGFKETTYNIFSCFIESGIPIMVALGNNNYLITHPNDRYIGHAVMCIGHEYVTHAQIDSLVAKATVINSSLGNVSLMDFDDIEKQFVYVDDNFPPYQLDRLDKPTDRYVSQMNLVEWGNCQLMHFVVPLHNKINIEPFLVKKFVKELLSGSHFPEYKNNSLVIRTFLCSTRSYRDYIKRNDMTNEMKSSLCHHFLPKFIWVIELTSIDLLKQNKANGLIVLDATESKIDNYAPLVVALHCNMKLERTPLGLVESDNPTKEFTIYQNNLV